MPIDKHRMIDTAFSFFLGGERCGLEMAFKPKDRKAFGVYVEPNAYPSHRLDAATSTNYSIACEIMLKCLALGHKSEKLLAGHDLGTMFCRLDKASRRNVWESYSNRHYGYRAFLKKLKPTYARPVTDKPWKKRPHLEVARYPYELEFAVFEIEFLREFFIACRRALKLQNPEYLSFFERELGIRIE